MATVRANIALNMLNDFDFSAIPRASSYEGSSNRFVAHYSNGLADDFLGSGFRYDRDGIPTGAGVITRYTLRDGGEVLVDVAGGRVPVRAVIDAALTRAKADDLAVIRSALAGHDAVIGSNWGDTLDGFGGNDSIAAGGGNDVLYGEAGNDRLDGGIGADAMAGGIGNDSYIVDNVRDVVVEASNQGFDAVAASVGFVLSARQAVEVMTTTSQAGAARINLTGNELAQSIAGNNGSNILRGEAGNDRIASLGGNDVLYGGFGADTLAGGVGSDSFVFDTAPNSTRNVDRILDFNVSDDTIWLDNAVMPGLGATGRLSANAFWRSTTAAAHDADDRVIYETDTGRLFYDSNGSAAGGATLLAVLSPNLVLTNADFIVV